MRKYKYFICAGDLIFIAQGVMSKVRFYSRKPECCQDTICDLNQLLEVFIHIPNPITNGKGKGSRKKLDGSSKKRKIAPKGTPRLSRNSPARHKKNPSKKIIT